MDMPGNIIDNDINHDAVVGNIGDSGFEASAGSLEV